ncbi:SRPBCC family protein [Populibacterium corticicola]|uniref:SRPBCC family protein n=1 Tax=Populibacterium corticicola TaxID=1812826 RepID=A0ABW5XH59_9MICO
MTIKTTAQAIINASPDVAWTILADYANDPLWRENVLKMEQSPSGPVFDGAQAIEELRVLGRSITTHIEVSDVRPLTGFSWRAVDGTKAHGIRTLEELPDGKCLFKTERQITLQGVERLLEPLVGWLMNRTERKDVLRAAILVERRSHQ